MKTFSALVVLFFSSMAFSSIRGFECESDTKSNVSSNHFVIQIQEDLSAKVYALDRADTSVTETLYRPVWEQKIISTYSYLYTQGRHSLVYRRGDVASEIIIPKNQIDDIRFTSFYVQVKFENSEGRQWTRGYQCQNKNRKGV